MFNQDGTYNKTLWQNGDVITSEKMNKIEETLEVINDNEYTVAVWYNERTQFKHFRRRYFDTLLNSVTVKEGSIAYYHIFRVIP